MKPFNLQTAADWCGGKIVGGDSQMNVTAVTTDTRAIKGGELFVALVGERFDAHDFLAEAASKGAVAALVSRVPEGFDQGAVGLALVLVDDTLSGLQDLARNYRSLLDPLVVAVTGSNGKTSTKDLLAAVLGTKYKVHATPGNLNNHIGLPLTLLSTPEDTTCVICEIGMSNPGEIAPLAEIARPDISVITNVGTAHIEFMGSREAIALEKGMLAEAVGSDGFVILNSTDDYSQSIADRTEAKVIMAGVEAGEVRAEQVAGSGAGSVFTLTDEEHSAEVDLPVPGIHMVGNATLAAAAALSAGADLASVADALTKAKLTGGRLQRVKVAGLDVVDDSYNANPDSVKAAIVTLEGLPCNGRRIAVLGRMAELGAGAKQAHADVGLFAAEHGVDELISVGAIDAPDITIAASVAGMGEHALHFDTAAECAGHLASSATPEDLILVKGSRSSRMEAVLEQLSTNR